MLSRSLVLFCIVSSTLNAQDHPKRTPCNDSIRESLWIQHKADFVSAFAEKKWKRAQELLGEIAKFKRDRPDLEFIDFALGIYPLTTLGTSIDLQRLRFPLRSFLLETRDSLFKLAAEKSVDPETEAVSKLEIRTLRSRAKEIEHRLNFRFSKINSLNLFEAATSGALKSAMQRRALPESIRERAKLVKFSATSLQRAYLLYLQAHGLENLLDADIAEDLASDDPPDIALSHHFVAQIYFVMKPTGDLHSEATARILKELYNLLLGYLDDPMINRVGHVYHPSAPENCFADRRQLQAEPRLDEVLGEDFSTVDNRYFGPDERIVRLMDLIELDPDPSSRQEFVNLLNSGSRLPDAEINRMIELCILYEAYELANILYHYRNSEP